MFVFLSKFLPPFVYPLGLAILFIIAALLLRKRQRIRTSAEILAVLLLVLFSNRAVSSSLARSLEWQYLPSDTLPSAEVIVLLGGGTEPAQYPRPAPELNGAGDRLLQAVRLYRAQKAPTILVSGGNISWLGSSATTPAEDMRLLLVEMGIPNQAIWLESQSQNTYENALYCARILQQKSIHKVILVTSAVHMPRSVALFKKQGIEVIPSPADFAITADSLQGANTSPGSWLVNLLPSAGSLSMTSEVLKEYIGIFVYHLRGWM